MALFRCLKSKTVTNAVTSADLGESTTTIYTLPNTPLVAGTLEGTIYRGETPVQTFTVDIEGVFEFFSIEEDPEIYVTDGNLNIGTGVVTLTWSEAPDTNFAIVSFTGLPIYTFLSKKLYGVSCPKGNSLCSSYSTAWVAAVTCCDLHL